MRAIIPHRETTFRSIISCWQIEVQFYNMTLRKLFFEILVGLVLSYLIIAIFFSEDRKFENLALGTETATYNAVDKAGMPFHIQRTNKDEYDVLLKAWQQRGSKPVILFLGNSQTHSINQQKSGEVNFIELLNRKAEDTPYEILCISLPNAGLQEFYLIYEYWKNILPLKLVVLPVFMDDLREDGIRDVFFSKLVQEKFQLSDTSNALVSKINRELRSYWSSNDNTKANRDKSTFFMKETFQEKSEKYLNHKLDSSSTTWVNRANVRGEFFNWLYKLRNTLLGIKANTVRKMIPQRFEDNMHAVELLVKSRATEQTKFILYIPPIRGDAKLPYDLDGYTEFKERVRKLSGFNSKYVFYRNYEGIIPPELWGYKAATNLQSEREVDYMHFQYKGHQILCDSVQVVLHQVIYKDGI